MLASSSETEKAISKSVTKSASYLETKKEIWKSATHLEKHWEWKFRKAYPMAQDSSTVNHLADPRSRSIAEDQQCTTRFYSEACSIETRISIDDPRAGHSTNTSRRSTSWDRPPTRTHPPRSGLVASGRNSPAANRNPPIAGSTHWNCTSRCTYSLDNIPRNPRTGLRISQRSTCADLGGSTTPRSIPPGSLADSWP